ncbi:MAG: alkaline shock response membrane anchor protein AmaP [Actinomycetota bacterium]|nr:alkaline shock response membrane anchor protein AmaP [Actinomycetota bacterium]
MIRRPRRTVPATIVSLILLAGSLGVAISCIQLISGRPPLIPFAILGELGRDATWNDPIVLVGGAALAVTGLVLLICALLPGTPLVLALASDSEHIDAGVTRHSLARGLTTHVGRADGITHARVKIGSRVIKVTARTPLRDHSGLVERIGDVVTERLDDINLARRPRLRITIASDRKV